MKGSMRLLAGAQSRKYFVPYQLSAIQKGFLVPYFGLGALADPNRGDYVAGLADATGSLQLERLKLKLSSTEKGRKVLLDKPLLSSLNMAAFEKLPEGTLGRGYYNYMSSHGFNPDERSTVRYINCPDNAYVMMRYRQSHDYWHVLCDLPPTELGEIALKVWEFKLTGLPMTALSSILGPLRLSSTEKSLLVRYFVPWVLNSRFRFEDLLSYPYEENAWKTVEEVRQELKIDQAPKVVY